MHLQSTMYLLDNALCIGKSTLECTLGIGEWFVVLLIGHQLLVLKGVIMSAKRKCMYCFAVITVLIYFVSAGSAWALAQVLHNQEIGMTFGAFAVTATFVVCGLVLGATDKCGSYGVFFLAIGAILSLILNVVGAGLLIYNIIIPTPRDLDDYTVHIIVRVGAASAFLALLTGLLLWLLTWCDCVQGRDENGEYLVFIIT